MPRLDDSYTRYPRPILWLVRGGETTIGDDTGDAAPRFVARVGSFYLSKLPVTNRQFEAFRSDFERGAASAGDDDAAVGVSWEDAAGYCAWYARVSRKPMRLPTEVEWEHACRAGATGRWFWGDDAQAADAHARHAGNSGHTLPPLLGLAPNGFGLVSMLGGVWEWTASLHRPYPVHDGDGRDDPQAGGPRVLRGGSFRTPLAELGCARRRAGTPSSRLDDVGFRVARSL